MRRVKSDFSLGLVALKKPRLSYVACTLLLMGSSLLACT